MKLSYNRKTFRIILIILAVIAVLIILYRVMDSAEQKSALLDESIVYDYSGDAKNTVFYNGREYTAKPHIETILVLGIDKYVENANAVPGSKNSMQSDFIALLVMNADTKTADLLMINRDTMCDVDTIGMDGKYAGTDEMQIALAHTYGSGGADSCENAVRTVKNLLGGAEINHYAAFTMDAVPVINDLCGGIKVKITDDFGDDPVFVLGSEVTLRGTDALRYVRARGEIAAEPTNINRMSRQREYLESLYKAAREKAAKDGSFVYNAGRKAADYITSDLSVNDLSNFAERLKDYEPGGIYTVPGTADYSGEYVRFYIDEDALNELVLQLLYNREDN